MVSPEFTSKSMNSLSDSKLEVKFLMGEVNIITSVYFYIYLFVMAAFQ